MSDIRVGSVVVSLKGRDAGRVMMAVGVSDGFADVCDGRKRRLEAPKRKRLSHLSLVSSGDAPAEVYAELTNGRLWKYLEPYRAKQTCSGSEERN